MRKGPGAGASDALAGPGNLGDMALRQFLFFTAIGLAIVIAFIFFRIYGPLAGPEVPLPVSATVEHFAPGIAIGSTMKESTKKLRGIRWMQHVGFIGAIDGKFTQARLFPSLEARRKPIGDDDARVEAVELVSVRGSGIPTTMSDLGIVFRASPKDGCIVPSTDEMPYRRVQYWISPNDRGGVALITDWTFKPASSTAGVAVWSMLAWSGPFQGSKTLLAQFDPRSCVVVAPS
jgi:hypothetical protein